MTDTKKVKHSVTMRVFEDDTTDFEFVGADGWPAGKMLRMLERAGRQLRSIQNQISSANIKAQREAEAAQEAKQAQVEAQLRDVKNLSKKLEKAVTSGDATIADVLKARLDNLKTGDSNNADDTGSDGGNVGESGEQSEGSNGGTGQDGSGDPAGAAAPDGKPGNTDKPAKR